jgi:hypothetical protein
LSGPICIDEDDDGADFELILPDSPCVFIIDEDDTPDVLVCIPGPPGPPLLDYGSRATPISIMLTIPAPQWRRQRTFIVGAGGPSDPVIANPSDNGAWELYLFGTNDTDTITLETGGNLLLSGQWIGGNGSMLYLQWDGATQYVEGGRNEI